MVIRLFAIILCSVCIMQELKAYSILNLKSDPRKIEFTLKANENTYFEISSNELNFFKKGQNGNLYNYEAFPRNKQIVQRKYKIYITSFELQKKVHLVEFDLGPKDGKSLINKDTDILVEIDKQNVNYGEGVIIKYSLLSNLQYLNYRISKFPSYDGFVKRFVDPGNSTKSINFEGKLKYITPLYLVELFPIKGREYKIHNMEIILNENQINESVLISENPKIKIENNLREDIFKNIKIDFPAKILVNSVNDLIQKFRVRIYGSGFLEDIDSLYFDSKFIKKQKTYIVDQKYRPGYGEKTFEVILNLDKNKSGFIPFKIKDKIIGKIDVDTFVTNEFVSNRPDVINKFIFNDSNYFFYILVFFLFFFFVFLFFPKNSNQFIHILSLSLILNAKNLLPIDSYRKFLFFIFPYRTFGLYFSDRILLLDNLPCDVSLTIKKIKFLYLEFTENLDSGNTKVRINLIEFFNLMRFFNRISNDHSRFFE